MFPRATWLGAIALVTLIRSSDNLTIPAEQLVEEIREAIQTSTISKNWSVEKVSILNNSELRGTDFSPDPANKTRSYGD